MSAKVYELQWVDILSCAPGDRLYAGLLKGECLRVNKLLKQQIEKGNVEQVKRGRYRLIVEDAGSIDETAP
jgi:hypothetical protein